MSTKKEKQPLTECDARIKEIRLQLNEQTKTIDQNTDFRSGHLNDIQDFFKRKSEIESEYAKKLDSLSEKYLSKHKQFFLIKREQPDYSFPSSLLCWIQILEQCQRDSKDHSMLSNIYLNQILPRIQVIAEDVTRIHKKNREMTLQMHEDFLQDLRKLYSAIQLYQTLWGEYVQAESKLKQADKQLDKRNDKGDFPKNDGRVRRSTSLRKLEKVREKRWDKYSEANLKCIKARNEYILQLHATNATLSKYYLEDTGKLLDTETLGYHSSLHRTWNIYCDAEAAAHSSSSDGIRLLTKCVDRLDPVMDKNIFLDTHRQTFTPLASFAFLAHSDDEVKKVSLTIPQLHREMGTRCKEMKQKMHQMTTDQEEQKKSLEASLKSMKLLELKLTCDVKPSFAHTRNLEDGNLGSNSLITSGSAPQPYLNKEMQKIITNLNDTGAYYLLKYGEFLQKSNQLNRLEARHTVLEKALEEEVPLPEMDATTRYGSSRATPKPSKKSFVRRKRSKKSTSSAVNHYHRNLEKYLEESGRSIPLIVESCIRMINLYGLHHQGIFRVPGSHQDILDMKACFEKGEDPVSEKQDKTDINTVAGLLKLYFRELDEKLFPQYVFDDLVLCAHKVDMDERTTCIRKVVLNIPESVLVVMRYLFAFLNHLSQNSDENMMDAYNIAVCFGPTLLPVPDTYDQVTTQANVNEIVKTIVMYHDQIFPADMDGPVYEKVMASDQFVEDSSAPPDENADPDVEAPDIVVHSSSSDDDSEQLYEGLAKYDYKGRSERELTFLKGDILILYKRANEDWWQGSFKGKDGLVPDAYIAVQDYRSDEISDVTSSRAESEVSLDSGGNPQSPVRRGLSAGSNRRLSGETSRLQDGSKFPTKTKSLDRHHNVQDYMRQQKAMATIANKAALQAAARSSESTSRTLPIGSSLRQEASTLAESEEADDFDADKSALSVKERIANLRRSSKNVGILDASALQDIDETMKNALSELQALDTHGVAKAAPDVVLDTLDPRPRRSFVDPTANMTSGSKPTSPPPQSSGQWKTDHLRSVSSSDADTKRLGRASKNSNNNATSHYQVPTSRHHSSAFARSESGADPIESFPVFHRDSAGVSRPQKSPDPTKYAPSKHGPRKTAF